MFVLCLPLALYTDEWLYLTLCIAHKVFTVVVSIQVTSYPPFKDFHAFFLPVLRRIAYKPLKRLGFLCTDAIGPFTLYPSDYVDSWKGPVNFVAFFSFIT